MPSPLPAEPLQREGVLAGRADPQHFATGTGGTPALPGVAQTSGGRPGVATEPAPGGRLPWLLAGGLAALVLLPFILADLGVPTGYFFRGTLKPSGDESQYLAAVRMGGGGAWLWHDPYMVHQPPLIVMYPIYLAAGHLGTLLGLGTRSSFALLHALAAPILFSALWRLATPFLNRRQRGWFVAFALFAGGLYWLVAGLAAAGHAPISLSAMGTERLSAFTALLMETHLALGIAGQVLAISGILGAASAGRPAPHEAADIDVPGHNRTCTRLKPRHKWRGVSFARLAVGFSPPSHPGESGLKAALAQQMRLPGLKAGASSPGKPQPAHRGVVLEALIGAAGVLLVGLSIPVLLPLTLLVVGLVTLERLWAARSSGALLPYAARLVPLAALICLPGLLIALYYYHLFSAGAWAVGGFQSVPATSWTERLLDWGILLPFGWWGWRHATAQTRPLAAALAIWIGCAVIASQLPLWQGDRLTVGISVPLGALFALGLAGTGARPVRLRRWLLGLGAGVGCHYLFLCAALLSGGSSSLYATGEEHAAARWLASHARPGAVVLAPFGFANTLPIVAPVRVVAGHGYQTLDLAARLPQLTFVYGGTHSAAQRVQMARATGASILVLDRLDRQSGTFFASRLPGAQVLYRSANLVVFRLR